MKATGIIRRVDELGRVVIPKEVRRNLGIRDGDPLEIYTEGKAVCFVKYSAISDLVGKVAPIIDTLNENGIPCALYDNCECKECGDINAPNQLEYDCFSANQFAIKVDGEFIGFIATADCEPKSKMLIEFAVQTIANIVRG